MVNKQKILIVDDDENIAELISLYLTKECFDTMIVHDGEEALKAFDLYRPSLILLDLMLPGIDGYQVCREIRSRSQTPIIMLSAKGEVFDKVLHQAEQSGKKLIFSASWGRQVIVRLTDMYYLERELRYTMVHTSWGDFQIKEKLDDLIHSLPEGEFSRCHHSYIIYLPAVREKRKNSYILENGKEIAISRSYMKQTNEDWMRWALLQMS